MMMVKNLVRELIKKVLPILTGVILIEIFGISGVSAQITPDTGTGATGTTITPLSGNPNQLDIGGGKLTGANLFHSFGDFNLSRLEIANFLSGPGIENILGRVTGGNPSIINGIIRSTGSNANLFLLNPAGVVFGGSAGLNVNGSFTATTANRVGMGHGYFNASGVNDYSSLTGIPNALEFTSAKPGVMVNSGNLAVTQGNNLALIGGTVINTGSLSAPQGRVILGGVPGSSIVRLGVPGNLLGLEIESKAATTASPLSLPELLTGPSGADITAATGLSSGANGVKLSSGTVVPALSGVTVSSGIIDVGGTNGGIVGVIGSQVGLVDGAQINASGTTQGGTVLVGGEFKGGGSVFTADYSYLAPNTMINASALSSGDGGYVIVWADKKTVFSGTILARGGAVSGDGGFVETSGKEGLMANGTVNAGAGNGIPGIWLLDPTDITITGADANIAPGTPAAGTGLIIPIADGATVNKASVLTALAANNVMISTEPAAVNVAGQLGDIIIGTANGDDLDLTSINNGNTLTLNAANVVRSGGGFITSKGGNANLVINVLQNATNRANHATAATASDAIILADTLINMGVAGTGIRGTTTLNLGGNAVGGTATYYLADAALTNSMMIKGPNGGINPNTQIRNPEAIIVSSAGSGFGVTSLNTVSTANDGLVLFDGILYDGVLSLPAGNAAAQFINFNPPVTAGAPILNLTIVNSIIRNSGRGGSLANLPQNRNFANGSVFVEGNVGTLIVQNSQFTNIGNEYPFSLVPSNLSTVGSVDGVPRNFANPISIIIPSAATAQGRVLITGNTFNDVVGELAFNGISGTQTLASMISNNTFTNFGAASIYLASTSLNDPNRNIMATKIVNHVQVMDNMITNPGLLIITGIDSFAGIAIGSLNSAGNPDLGYQNVKIQGNTIGFNLAELPVDFTVPVGLVTNGFQVKTNSEIALLPAGTTGIVLLNNNISNLTRGVDTGKIAGNPVFTVTGGTINGNQVGVLVGGSNVNLIGVNLADNQIGVSNNGREVNITNSTISGSPIGVLTDNSGGLTRVTGTLVTGSTQAAISNNGGITQVTGASIGNSATGINNQGGTVSVSSSFFQGNGFGITNNGGNISVNNSTIANSVLGGVRANTGSTIVRASNLSTNNTGVSVGGGVVTLENGSVINNANSAIFNQGGTVNAIGATISTNTTGVNHVSGNTNITASSLFGNVTGATAQLVGSLVISSSVIGQNAVGVRNAGFTSVQNSSITGNSNGLINTAGTSFLINTNVTFNGVGIVRQGGTVFSFGGSIQNP